MKFHENRQRLKKSNSHLCGDFNPFGCLIYTKLRFLETDFGIAPQPAQDSDQPLVWPKGCSHKVPKGLSKNILKKLKRKMWGKLPPGFSCLVVIFLGFFLYVGEENSENQKIMLEVWQSLTLTGHCGKAR